MSGCQLIDARASLYVLPSHFSLSRLSSFDVDEMIPYIHM